VKTDEETHRRVGKKERTRSLKNSTMGSMKLSPEGKRKRVKKVLRGKRKFPEGKETVNRKKKESLRATEQDRTKQGVRKNRAGPQSGKLELHGSIGWVPSPHCYMENQQAETKTDGKKGGLQTRSESHSGFFGEGRCGINVLFLVGSPTSRQVSKNFFS